MEKRKIQTLFMMVFTVALTVTAVLGNATQSEELALLQSAMRELRRVDNLEFSYESMIGTLGTTKSEKINVWADQLTGSWVSEHYTTDEDGTRLYLKRVCDGTQVYHYEDWSGEWILQKNEKTEVPYLDQVIDLPYGRSDIVNVELIHKGDVQELSYQFTEEYIAEQNAKTQAALEEYYENYQKIQTSEEEEKEIEVAVEQYRRTREENIEVTYQMDAAGVMRGLSCFMLLISPEILHDVQGEPILGEEYTSSYQIEINIKRYNQEGVMNKINQCKAEAAYYEYE